MKMKEIENIQEYLSVLNNTVSVEWKVITPELAKRMLSKNTDNYRHIKQNNVNIYADDMSSGNWEINGETISFDNNGVLLNGQHRLAAIIKSNTPIVSLVVQNLPTTKIYDIGSKRSAKEILRASGYEHINNSTIGAINIMLYGFIPSQTGKKGTWLTEAAYKADGEIFDIAYDLCINRKDSMCRKSSVIAAIYTALLLKYSTQEKIKQLIDITCTGYPADGLISTPGLALRYTLQNNANAWEPNKRKLQYHATLQAISDFEAQRDRKKRYTESEKMQKAYEITRDNLIQRINKEDTYTSTKHKAVPVTLINYF